MTVLEAATADAGGPYVTCGPDPVSITAITNGTGNWSGGAGTFANSSAPQTTYTAAPSEFATTVVLTWTTDDPDGAGPCPDASDSYAHGACLARG
ncbi:MAG: hypothetical protein IPP26_01505 [Flavobacteriales bacterium]|nr:hypothetical protein [Flavobacteriales bacterium]